MQPDKCPERLCPLLRVVSRAFLLLLCSIVVMAQTPAVEKKKSLVLKDRTPERMPFHLRNDNSRQELWNEFMLVKNANSGDPIAQHELGLRYLMGKGFPADTGKAAYWIRKAADQNLLSARYNLGILLNNGLSVEWDPFGAYRHFRYAAEHGMVEAEYVYSLLLTDNLTVTRNYREAYRWIRMAADADYAPAQEVLLEFRRRGIDVDTVGPDEGGAETAGARSVSDSTAASQRVPASVKALMLDFGSDSVAVPNEQEMMKDALLEANPEMKERLSISDGALDSADLRPLVETADAGNPEMLALLGFWYEHGPAVNRDIVTATVYFLRAIRFESSSARLLLWGMIQDKKYFSELKARVIAHDPAAEFSWSGLVAFGFDHQLTEEQSFAFLSEAAGQNFVPAMVELGICYYTGFRVKQDRENAVRLLKQAALRGSREARLRLSTIEFMSTRTTAPDSSTLGVLRTAVDDGSVLAQQMLGYFFQEGIGVRRDKSESIKYYRKAAQRGSQVAYDALRTLYDEIRPKEMEFQIRD